MSPRRHVAVDLGASGGRVAVGTIANGKLQVEVVHRFSNHAIPLRGDLYWDVLALWREILQGLGAAAKRGPVESVGVDSWAVDFALLDRQGRLLDGIHHYRSARNAGAMERVVARLGRDAIYEHTGIQFLPFNTAYQFEALNADGGLPQTAERVLLVPDLFHYWLSGKWSNERTNASTTQLYNPETRTWSESMLEAVGVRSGVFEPISEPGTVLGDLAADIVSETGLTGTKVVLPATHDTASAVAAIPAEGGAWAYVSSGTWSLVGIETGAPVLTREAMEANLTNEAGIGGTTRFLKNVMGLWILQECRRGWGDPPFGELYAEAEAAGPQRPFDCDAPEFLAPGLDMAERVFAACGKKMERGATVRAIFESLAQRTAEVIETLERVARQPIRTIHIVGGGSEIELLNRLIVQRTGRPVVAGPVEATLMGNILVQAEACGSIPRGQIRKIVRESSTLRRFEP